MSAPLDGSAVGAEERAVSPVPDVVVCPGGPLLLRGEHTVQAADGSVHPTTRPLSAVCRCGASATAPWCDGTHKQLRHPLIDKSSVAPA